MYSFSRMHPSSSLSLQNLIFRPWYVESMNTVGKNVVIVIDASGSMGDQYEDTTLLELAKTATRLLISTLSSLDHVSA